MEPQIVIMMNKVENGEEVEDKEEGGTNVGLGVGVGVSVGAEWEKMYH